MNESRPNLKLLSVEDLKEMLNISQTTVYRLVYSRQIPFYKVGHALRFKMEDIEIYLEENKFNKLSDLV